MIDFNSIHHSKRTWRLVLVLSSQRSPVHAAADDELINFNDGIFPVKIFC